MDNDNRDSVLSAEAGGDAQPRSVTAFFDAQDAADSAYRDLIAAGVMSGDIQRVGGAAGAEVDHPHDFWESLTAFFLPVQDRHIYAEGLRRGGFAISVRTDSVAYRRVIALLDRDGAVDIDERAAAWRDEGWNAAGSAGEREMAYAPAADGTGGFAASRVDQPLFEGPIIDTAAIEPGQIVPPEPAAIVPERDLTHGRTRVRSYIGGNVAVEPLLR